MTIRHLKNGLRTWIEIDKKAIYGNISEFRGLIKPQIKLMAIIKSNAYGHGLIDFAKTAEKSVDWFGVDSITEGLKLRQKGLKKPILVLGYTLPSRLEDAAKNDISITVSNFEALKAMGRLKYKPEFHIKIDTGMHRQGFFIKDLPQTIKIIRQLKICPEGIYTHFAAAKDKLYPSYSFNQIEIFKKADRLFESAFGKKYLRHVSASAGTLLYPEAHFDMVRIGIGLYGLYPTKESEIQTGVKLKPVLSWKSIIGEIKSIPANSFIGYDLTEKILKPSKIAIIPVGYWHGVDRGLSSIGELLVKGKRCKILGRVSMDMTAIDISNLNSAIVGDEVIILGKSKNESIDAEEIARKIGTTNYEIITRINPLIKRIYL